MTICSLNSQQIIQDNLAYMLDTAVLINKNSSKRFNGTEPNRANILFV